MKKLLLLLSLSLLSFNIFATPVNINKADAKEIASALKGIGPAKAEAIVKYRKKNGPFKSVDDLKNVKGIGEKIISNIAADTGLSPSKGKKTAPAKIKEKKAEKKSAAKSEKKVEKSAKKDTKSSKKPKAKKLADKKAKK
jgi:competence protein ComEA